MAVQLILILLLSSPPIKWGRIYGGDNHDYARAVIECPDQGFIAVGATNSYPSPFRNTLRIKIVAEDTDDFSLIRIYDTMGRLIKVLKPLNAQSHDFTWDGTTENGREVSPGIYFISAESFAQRILKPAVKIK